MTIIIDDLELNLYCKRFDLVFLHTFVALTKYNVFKDQYIQRTILRVKSHRIHSSYPGSKILLPLSNIMTVNQLSSDASSSRENSIIMHIIRTWISILGFCFNKPQELYSSMHVERPDGCNAACTICRASMSQMIQLAGVLCQCLRYVLPLTAFEHESLFVYMDTS